MRTTPIPASLTGCSRRLTGVPNTNADTMAFSGQMLSRDTQTGFNGCDCRSSGNSEPR